MLWNVDVVISGNTNNLICVFRGIKKLWKDEDYLFFGNVVTHSIKLVSYYLNRGLSGVFTFILTYV